MTDEEFQRGVLRRLEALEHADEQRAATLRSLERHQMSSEAKDAIEAAHREMTNTRLSSIESNITWLVRLVMGALLLAVVGFALRGGFNVPV